MSGFLVSALIGLAMLVIGLLIVRFTPESQTEKTDRQR
jgi:uncharacterized membrane-anchored protein YhcB (DUF1043 family)